jgi:broad specificity phosphatase PhoE
MDPKRIILIRHGKSVGNANPEINSRIPDYALKLNEEGIMQAKESGKNLKDLIKEETAFFYISPYWRTRMTFEEIARHFSSDRYKFIEEPRLREQEWGHQRSAVETKLIEEERDAYGPFYFRFPDGESGADVYDRVSSFFGTLFRDFEKRNFPENAVIITHGMTIRLFIMKWFHMSVEDYEKFANPENCQLIVLERESNGKYLLKSELKTHEVKHKYQRPLKIKSDNEAFK